MEDDVYNYRMELSDSDVDRLSKAAGQLDAWGSPNTPPSVHRYALYRRRGHNRAVALRYALAWCKNSNDQYERRLSHDTGAEGWRKIVA